MRLDEISAAAQEERGALARGLLYELYRIRAEELGAQLEEFCLTRRETGVQPLGGIDSGGGL